MVIADVSGHSVGAALIMVETRSVLRAQVHASNSTREILTRLNELLYDDLSRAELFITMFYLKYNDVNRQLSYSSAGHNQPILYRSSTASCVQLDAEGLILGVKEEVEFEEKSITLQAGDVLLLYTDGVTEAANSEGDMFGMERLCQLVVERHTEPADAILAAIYREVSLFADASSLADDISTVVMKLV